MSAPCPAECLQSLNDSEIRPGAYVLYWMQQAQRAEDNLALETAIFHANRLRIVDIQAYVQKVARLRQ